MRKAAFLTPLLLLGLATAATAQQDTSNVLDEYVKRAQPKYGWTDKGTEPLQAGVVLHRLELTSQTWMGRDWKHRLNVLIPPAAQGNMARPGHAILGIVGSANDKQILMFLSGVAVKLGVPVAVLHDIPNQPLFADTNKTGKGLKEDALIAHTFQRFAQTGNSDWPALLPMTRSVVAAMDALAEYSTRQAKTEGWAFGTLTKFVTTGASKRGWTTWLSGIADDRVIAIAPIVFDNLSIRAQIELHMDTWGKPSPSIHDYTERGLMDMIDTPRGEELLRIIDPYAYADRLDLPKLAMIGTNDTYWPLEAIHIYKSRLPGNLFCHYVPNAGHRAGPSIVQALVGFFDHVTNRIPALPMLSLAMTPRKNAHVTTDGAESNIRAVRVWTTRIEGRDFTKAKWVQVSAEPAKTGWQATLPAEFTQSSGRAAFIGEAEMSDASGGAFKIHTPVQVWELGPVQ